MIALKKVALSLLALVLFGCAHLHHVQIGEVDNSPGYVLKPFEIKISENGIDIGEVKAVSKVFMSDSQRQEADRIAAFISVFQMGPRTGNPVYVKDYAKNLIQIIYEKCPTGRVTGLSSIRETRKYPIVSGEIVNVTGFCMLPRGGQS